MPASSPDEPARQGDQHIEQRPDGREQPVRWPPSRLVKLLVPVAWPKDCAGRRRAEARGPKGDQHEQGGCVHKVKVEGAACVSSGPSHRLPVPLCGEFAGAHRGKQRDDLPGRRQPHQDVNDPSERRAGPEYRGHEIEAEQADQPPVQPTHDEKDERQDIDELHCFFPAVWR